MSQLSVIFCCISTVHISKILRSVRVPQRDRLWHWRATVPTDCEATVRGFGIWQRSRRITFQRFKACRFSQFFMQLQDKDYSRKNVLLKEQQLVFIGHWNFCSDWPAGLSLSATSTLSLSFFWTDIDTWPMLADVSLYWASCSNAGACFFLLRRFYENRCPQKATWAGHLPEELRPRWELRCSTLQRHAAVARYDRFSTFRHENGDGRSLPHERGER